MHNKCIHTQAPTHTRPQNKMYPHMTSDPRGDRRGGGGAGFQSFWAISLNKIPRTFKLCGDSSEFTAASSEALSGAISRFHRHRFIHPHEHFCRLLWTMARNYLTKHLFIATAGVNSFPWLILSPFVWPEVY